MRQLRKKRNSGRNERRRRRATVVKAHHKDFAVHFDGENYSYHPLDDGANEAYDDEDDEEEDAGDDDGSSSSSSSSFGSNFEVCGRQTSWPANLTRPLFDSIASRPSCDPSSFDPNKPTLVLEGSDAYGRAGNQLQSFFHAVQFARDNEMQLAVMKGSWAADALFQFFLADESNGNNKEGWRELVEETLCAKFVDGPRDAEG